MQSAYLLTVFSIPVTLWRYKTAVGPSDPPSLSTRIIINWTNSLGHLTGCPISNGFWQNHDSQHRGGEIKDIKHPPFASTLTRSHHIGPRGMATPPAVTDDITETLRTNYVGFCAFTILIWDHLDTFTAEVEYIWRGEKGLVVYLFLLNRYLTPLGFIVNLFAYLSPSWTQERCRRFIRFEGAMTVIGIHIAAMMMLLRINALYSAQRIIVACVFLLFLIMLGVNAWLLTRGEPVIHNPASGMRACTMIFPPDISAIASSSAWLPLLYDSVILGLTIFKTAPLVGRGNGTLVMKRLLEDGLIYYSAIFSVTLALTIMIISCPPGLKNIAAQYVHLPCPQR
ncbi:hypothetical protein FB45DRAFT_897880 [Roridomyces roridus]|uniref:DUF6533 domain-containing protein n=1 Tax=Roridomyces roridus TaxID=1738132 RepID=A0AAD7CBJ2_9AGAR|nr:hypothetical protein FB45DRAFT_897880 [Roridomyces roridus]